MSFHAAIAALILLLFAGPVQAQDWSALIPEVAPHLGRVEIAKGGNTGVCSAVVWELDLDGFAHALTAAHCVDRQPTERIDVTVAGRNAVAVHSNAILDLAILRFRARGETPIVLAAKSPDAGAAVAIVGYAFGLEQLAAQFGRVSVALSRETKAMLVDGMIAFGDSGGGVLNERGELVGINSRVLFAGSGGQMAHLAWIVPIEAVKDFLDDFNDVRKKR